jgi:hypothetical protein
MYRSLLLASLTVLGCSKGEGDAKTSSPPDLQLVSAGDEPRHRLRYQPVKATAITLELAIDIDVSAGDMGGPMPTIVETLSVTVEDVGPLGAKLRSTVLDATARERIESRVPPNALGGPLDLMKGVVLTATLSPSGRLFGTKLELGDKRIPDAAKTQLAALTASFDQLMMPLPDEPVGVGAVWRNSKALDQNGLEMTAVNTVSLAELAGTELTFTIDTQVHGDDQTVEQGELGVEVKDITGTGKGKGTVDLRTLAITSELATEFRSTMKAPGEATAMPMRMSITTRVAPK